MPTFSSDAEEAPLQLGGLHGVRDPAQADQAPQPAHHNRGDSAHWHKRFLSIFSGGTHELLEGAQWLSEDGH